MIGRTGLFVAAVDLAGECSRALRRAAALVQRAPPLARAGRRDAPRARSSIDAQDRVLLVQFLRPVNDATWWGSPGGGIDPGESRRGRRSAGSCGRSSVCSNFELGPLLFEHVGEFPWAKRIYRQVNTTYLVRVNEHDPRRDDRPRARRASPTCAGGRSDELESSTEQFAPPDLPQRVRTILGAMTAVLVTVHLLAAGIWFGGSTALIFVGVPAIRTLEGEPRGPRDEGARPALAAARLRRAARRRADGRRRSPRASGGTTAPFQIVFWTKVALFRLPARRVVLPQLRPRPAPAGGDPRRARAGDAADARRRRLDQLLADALAADPRRRAAAARRLSRASGS